MQVNSDTVAEAIAYCEAHCDCEEESRIVEWVAEHIGEALKRERPRFNVGAFEIKALPIKTAKLRESILAKLGPKPS